MVPFTVTIPSSYLMGHYNYPSMTKNGKKKSKNKLLDLSLYKPFFHIKCISWTKKYPTIS
jgi:hypothetical protein